MPYLTLPPSYRRRDRLVAHPELALGPGWVMLGVIGARGAWAWPISGLVPAVAIAASLAVVAAGLLLVAAAAAPARADARDDTPGAVPLSVVWMLERAGWITGISGWAAYGLIVGYSSIFILALTVTMIGAAALRLVALGRLEDHVRATADDPGRLDA